MREVPARPILVARDLTKVYRRGSAEVRAVDGISLDVRAGEFMAIMGRSGSGKTTLLDLLGCLLRPTSGQLEVDGRERDRCVGRSPRPDPAGAHRLRLPGVQPDPLARRRRERPAAASVRPAPPRRRYSRTRAAGAGGTGCADAASPQRAVGRRAAARGHCPGTRQRARRRARRRTDRGAGQHHLGRVAVHAARAECRAGQ